MALKSPEERLESFVDKFDIDVQGAIRSTRERLRARFPTAFELVYDNYNFLVIGYSPTPRPSDSVLSITANAKGVGLCFIQGAKLSDPQGRLLGSGKQTRFIRVPSIEVLEEPAVAALIDAAERQASAPFAAEGRGEVVVRSVSKRQRPRRSS